MAERAGAGEPYLTGPGSGALLPSLMLQHADGRPAPLWDYRGRGPLIVYLHEAPGCAPCRARLAELAAAHRGYRELSAQVLAVGQAPVADLPFPVLVDAPGRLAAALAQAGVLPAPTPPALLVVGRTGEIWAAWAGDHTLLPDQATIAQWLEWVLAECRECFCCELVWPAAWVRGQAPR
jgi:peroxiredoxin